LEIRISEGLESNESWANGPVRKTGAPFALGEWKLEALLQIFYRVGKGMKKYRALEVVSEAIGQSVDTIRDWKKMQNLMKTILTNFNVLS
jgi:hypothetical protein